MHRIPTSALALLFIARIAGGIAGANIPAAQAYIADVTTPENRARGMGLIGAAFGLGFIFGPAIGGLLSRISPETPMWCAAALCFSNFAAAWFLLPESRAASATTRTLGRLEAFRHASLVDIHLETGRTHQIRVHLAAIKHPCCGDPLYGADPALARKLGLDRQWLHAVGLGFEHPGTGAYVHFESEYPEDLQRALDTVATL